MEVFLYNQQFSPLPRFKRAVKKFLGMNLGGPEAVFKNLCLGLTELNINFKVNVKNPPHGANIAVLSGTGALRWAISQKKAGNIGNLIAGPNIVLTPFEANRLIMSEWIDGYLVPSQWSKDWWSNLAPQFSSKIIIWPAGVANLGELVNKNGNMLIFYKSGGLSLAKAAFDLGKKINLNPKIIRYGKYNPGEYINLLKQAKFLVYISESESQGLALHEAWMAGVPTLVWNRGFMAFGQYKWEDEKIAAPYLTEDCGMFFKNSNDLEEKLPFFLKNYSGFNPRKYSLENFTNKICAEKFINIFKF